MEQNKLTYGLENIPKEYTINKREAIKGVVIQNGKLLLMHTNKGDYKFPGGGLKKGEAYQDALKREMLEEAGYQIQKVGEILVETIEQNIDKFNENAIFSMKNIYVSCELSAVQQVKQNLDEYEQEQDFKPVFIEINKAIQINKKILFDRLKGMNEWVQRETDVLEVIKKSSLYQ